MDHLEPVVELRRSRYAEPRHVAPADWERYERHVAEIFAAFGMDLDTPGHARRRRPASCGRCTTRPPATRATRSC